MKMKLHTTYKWECVYDMEGEIFIASSYKKLVEQMRAIVYSQPTTNEQHRADTKKRFYKWDKTELNDSSDKEFVLSLIHCGYLKVLTCTRKALKTAKNK